MQTSNNRPINLKVIKCELNFLPPNKDCDYVEPKKSFKLPQINNCRHKSVVPSPPTINNGKKPNVNDLIESLLEELYSNWSNSSEGYYGTSCAPSLGSSQSLYEEQSEVMERHYLLELDAQELLQQENELKAKLMLIGERLGRCVRARDRYRRQQKRLCATFSALLRHIRQMSAILNSLRNLAGSTRGSSAGDDAARFSVTPGSGDGSGEGGYSEWLHAMRLVARLPAGVPQHFRKKLWLTLAERYLNGRGVDWSAAERACFRGSAQPDDAELGAQILKDLHRTGCSLFCGKEGRENQGMLRRVLLAYARWNKDVGYCQGFNMLAAIILEVMDKSESDSLKVMVYLVEAVLPEGYFADDLRGLSADMAAFRDLLRIRLPRLATHMDHLQKISDGGGVEPPLPDVFTMQWFLTLYATWLPRESLLRIWDLILLDGNEVLLLTALAIWDMLQDRILSARSADEYYSCMGGGAGAIWEAGDALVTRVVSLGTAPELPRLRNLHRYRVTPPVQPPPSQPPFYQPPLHSAMQAMTKKGLRLFYSEDEGDSSDEGNKMALATFVPRRDDRIGAGDRLSLDIGALKRQYARLRERQRQAHVILAAACARHAAVGVPTSPTSLTVNSLLLGKSAIVSSRGRRLGPPPGTIPPSRHTPTDQKEKIEPKTPEQTSDTISWVEEKHKKSLSRRNSLKWKDIKKENKSKNGRKPSIDLDETGDGVIVSEREADEMIATLRSRSSSESSTYSSHSGSSTDTSLCDEGASDSEPDIAVDNGKQKNIQKNKTDLSPKIKTKTVEETSNPEQAKKPRTSPPSSDINVYIKSPAGESLRSYISEFQNNKAIRMSGDEIDALLGKPKEVEKKKSNKTKREVNYFYNPCFVRDESLPSPPRFYSPISETSPNESPIRCSSNIIYSSTIEEGPVRHLILERTPPHVLESYAKYPNIVPVIDVSDKDGYEFESPLRSPDAESVVVSEDEPPIPLKIDKYFEHSPEFFGARITATNSNNPHIPTRRPAKRLVKPPRKPDSLTLQTSHNQDLIDSDKEERASSLPQYDIERDQIKITLDRLLMDFNTTEQVESINTSFKQNLSPNILESVIASPKENAIFNDNVSPRDLRLGRKNSERALQIIQENSKILSRILTKQNIPETNSVVDFKEENSFFELNEEAYSAKYITREGVEASLPESSLLKESTSDSLIGYNRKSNTEEFTSGKNDFLRNRPMSLDNSLYVDFMKAQQIKDHASIMKGIKSPSTDSLINKIDHYGWENKGFAAKHEYDDDFFESDASLQQLREVKAIMNKTGLLNMQADNTNVNIPDQVLHSNSMESKPLVTFPSTEHKETSIFDHGPNSEDYSYPLSTRYNDFVLTKASDICSKTAGLVPKVCENLSKTDNSQASDFAHVVTSSISFTYDPSAEDDSPIGAKSNSSDTLCQITSLDQVSTPISPKIFPRETPTNPKEFTDKSDRVRLESDDTCSAITSLLETDTISSLSYPRSPTTGSYHFPSRPPLRMPKELGVRLGMYPRDGVHSPSK